MNKNKKMEALDTVTRNIDLAIDSVGAVLSFISNCGLDKYDHDLIKDGMLTCLQILDMAFDKVEFAKDEEGRN